MGRGCAQQGLGALLGLRGAAVQQRLAVLLRVVEVPALHVVLRCHTHHPASSIRGGCRTKLLRKKRRRTEEEKGVAARIAQRHLRRLRPAHHTDSTPTA